MAVLVLLGINTAQRAGGGVDDPPQRSVRHIGLTNHFAGATMPHDATTMNQGMRQCIQECLDCYRVCVETVQHCLMLGGKHAEHGHIATLLACAEICRTSAHTMLLGSQHHAATCRACAEICRACEADCRSMGSGDEMMQKCADACGRCAESCDRMAA